MARRRKKVRFAEAETAVRLLLLLFFILIPKPPHFPSGHRRLSPGIAAAGRRSPFRMSGGAVPPGILPPVLYKPRLFLKGIPCSSKLLPSSPV